MNACDERHPPARHGQIRTGRGHPPPGEWHGIDVTDPLVEELVEAIRDNPGALPLLEFSLDQMWRALPPGKVSPKWRSCRLTASSGISTSARTAGSRR